MKKSLKQFIFEEMKRKGYVLDKELAKFQGKEPNFYQASVYAGEYRKLEHAKEHFKVFEDDPNTILHHVGRKYLIRDSSKAEGTGWWTIPKIYFDYLKEKGIKTICI